MTGTGSAAAIGLPIHLILAEPRRLARRLRLSTSTYDAAEHARAMNAILADLSVILSGGADVL